jgi:hypothetical protein
VSSWKSISSSACIVAERASNDNLMTPAEVLPFRLHSSSGYYNNQNLAYLHNLPLPHSFCDTQNYKGTSIFRFFITLIIVDTTANIIRWLSATFPVRKWGGTQVLKHHWVLCTLYAWGMTDIWQCYAPSQESTFSENSLLRKCHARPVAWKFYLFVFCTCTLFVLLHDQIFYITCK